MGIFCGYVCTDEYAVADVHRLFVSENAAGDPGIGRSNAKYAKWPGKCCGQTVNTR